MTSVTKRVIIESPYAGDVERNLRYARAALADSLKRGEAPFASHLLYTTVLNDGDPSQREQGIRAGLVWAERATLTAVYYDLGVSSGMREGIRDASLNGRPIEFRSLPEWAQ